MLMKLFIFHSRLIIKLGETFPGCVVEGLLVSHKCIVFLFEAILLFPNPLSVY